MKISRKTVDPKYFSYYVNNLWSAFTLMDNKDQIRKLFKDLFTHTEYKMFTKRLEIARRLLENQTYGEIMRDLKVTERTISNISNILEREGEGLRIAHEKLVQLDKHFQSKREKIQNIIERRVRRKMAGERVLPELLKAGALRLTKAVHKNLRKVSARKEFLD